MALIPDGQKIQLRGGWAKFAFVELYEKATLRVAGDFLRHLIKAVLYTVLTDNSAHFTTPGKVASAAYFIIPSLVDLDSRVVASAIHL